MGRERVPFLGQALEIGIDVLCEAYATELVGLGKNDAEWDVALSQPAHEFEVYLLGGMAAVDENKEVGEVLALKDVTADHLFELGALGFTALSETVARQVYEVPGGRFLGR